MGESDKPVMRYSTSEMAKDTLQLLDHVGWTGERSIHVIGISMGGMIAQEIVSHLQMGLWDRIGIDVGTGLSRAQKDSQSLAGIDSSAA